MKRPGKQKTRRIKGCGPAMAAIAGIAVSIVVWYLMIVSENMLYAQEFSNRANNQAHILQDTIDDYVDKLYAVRALFDSADGGGVTRAQFESFAKAILDGYPAILNVSWVPRVKREERATHELGAVHDGLPDYHIQDITQDGRLVVAPERDEYLPKYYSTEARSSPVYGLDLLKDFASTVSHIRDADVLSSSPPLLLQIGNGDRHGFWVGLPIYARGLPLQTVEDRRRNLLGIIQGVFQTHVLFDTILAKLKTPAQVFIFAPDSRVDDLPLYFRSGLENVSIEPKSQAALTTGPHLAVPLNIGDIQWKLVVTPIPRGFFLYGNERSTIVLICGLLLSGALASYLAKSSRYSRVLEIANSNIERRNLQFDAALNNMAQGLLMFDCAGELIVSNRRFAEVYGLPWEKWHEAAAGMTVSEAMQLSEDLTGTAIQDWPRITAELRVLLDQRQTGTIVFIRSDDRIFAASCAPMTDGGFVVTFEDITEARRKEEKISHLARYDALTDLPNRAFFYESMEKCLTGGRHGDAVAVLSLDLDHFKAVNDTLGHPIGDELLRRVADRMRSCVRKTDMVARLGGDEFVVIQTPIQQPADTTSLATRLIEKVGAPYDLDGHQVIVGTSIGITLAPADGTDPDRLMKNADLALYRCKAEGRGTYHFFEPNMDARMQDRRALELDLRKALVNDEFTLNYQPIINLKTGKISACEALIRWRHPERGIVPPMDFIPIAEETGLIVSIGDWVLQRACADAVEWPGDFAVAVNVSPAQFKRGKFVRTVADALEKTGLPACRLELEITELVLIQKNNSARLVLHQLKELGVSIAMDDFGTGYSSLGYLRSFPFDKIKIDRSFISDVPENADSLAILRAVVSLGRSLGIVTIAEGVETRNQLEVLLTEGCMEAQGYFFSKPRSAVETMELLSTVMGQSHDYCEAASRA